MGLYLATMVASKAKVLPATTIALVAQLGSGLLKRQDLTLFTPLSVLLEEVMNYTTRTVSNCVNCQFSKSLIQEYRNCPDNEPCRSFFDVRENGTTDRLFNTVTRTGSSTQWL